MLARLGVSIKIWETTFIFTVISRHTDTLICAHSLSHIIFGKTKSKYHISSVSSSKLFYICCFFSFQRTVVLNVIGAKPTPTQLQISTVALNFSGRLGRTAQQGLHSNNCMKEGKKKHPPKENYQPMFSLTLEILPLCKLCIYHSVIPWGIALLSFLLQE